VEAGSNDAESRSDSLHFEINRGWKVRKIKNEITDLIVSLIST
jgi:hypothetical protein